MHTLIAYDISDGGARRRFFAYLSEKGLHTQKSVFECELGREDVAGVLREAASLDLESRDSVVVYSLCRRCAGGCILLGQGISVAQEDWTII